MYILMTIGCISACSIKVGTLYMVLELLNDRYKAIKRRKVRQSKTRPKQNEKSANTVDNRVELHELMKETTIKTILHVILWFTLSVICKMALSEKISIERYSIALSIVILVGLIVYIREFIQIGGIYSEWFTRANARTHEGHRGNRSRTEN